MTIHGMFASREYSSWECMKQRCLNSNRPEYPNYGGRGIKVCDRWLDFANFYEDMGDRPEGLTLDRRDNDGDYTPENCRWATKQEQDRNRRTTVVLILDGVSRPLVEWSELLGINYNTLQKRRRMGWTTRQILSGGLT